MDFQTIIALGVVALCAAYVLRRWLRTWTGKSIGGCHGGGCNGCMHNTGCTGDAKQSLSPDASPQFTPRQL